MIANFSVYLSAIFNYNNEAYVSIKLISNLHLCPSYGLSKLRSASHLHHLEYYKLLRSDLFHSELYVDCLTETSAPGREELVNNQKKKKNPRQKKKPILDYSNVSKRLPLFVSSHLPTLHFCDLDDDIHSTSTRLRHTQPRHKHTALLIIAPSFSLTHNGKNT